MALFRIKRQNINESALNIDKFDATVQNQISVESIQAVYDSVNLAAPAITSVAYANSSYTVLDDMAANVSGGYIVISGSGFQSGAQITIGSDSATSVTHVNSSTIRAQIPAKDAGSYHLTLINPTGGISILVNGITYSNTPVWGTAGTLDNQAVDTAFAVTLSANSDSNVTYSNTTTLPAGTALLSNGYFYGTISGIESETTYNFTVAAIDEELQDNPREFSVTVTVGPAPGALYTWGRSESGSLGWNTADGYRSSPVQIGSDTDWSVISVSYLSVAAIKSNGTLWTWGRNANGQLAVNDIINRSSPVQVGSLTNWSKVSLSREHFHAIKTDGTLWTCGWGPYNGSVTRSSPVQVGSDSDWIYLHADYYLAGFIKSNNSLWMSGYGGNGALGNNSVGDGYFYRLAGTDWSSINIGYDVSMAIKTDGSLWVWGDNNVGKLGLNSTVNVSSPVQLGSETNWSSVVTLTATSTSAMAIKTDGSLWVWGNGAEGRLGLNSTVSVSSPVQLGSETNWSKIASGYYHSLAIKDDGTLWSWGRGTSGQLGDSVQLNRSSPVQIGTQTNWQNIEGGQLMSIAIKS
jgi:alpha-tubulin suppressor-like RCC1 family protein